MTIDFHTHAFAPKIAERAISSLENLSGLTALTGGLADELVSRLDEWGADAAVLLSVATKPSQQRTINDWAAKTAEIYPMLYPFGSVHPFAADASDEAERIKYLGLYGVKLHPDQQGFMIDDPRLDELFGTLSDLDLPVTFHTGFDFSSPTLIHAPPDKTLTMLKRHPRLKAVLAHLGGNEQWREVYETIAGADGEVYLDTAFTTRCPDELMTDIIKRHGAERVLFGSDCPWESPRRIKDKIVGLKLCESDKEKILGGNAVRLLGLDRKALI